VALLLLAVVAGAVMVVLANGRGSGAALGDTPGPTAGPSVSASAPTEELIVADGLRADHYWHAANLAGQGSCAFDGGLVARRDTDGVYRCQGPLDAVPRDLRVGVTVRLLTRDSCAGIWFRFRGDHGYLVWICEKNIYVGTHKGNPVVPIRSYPLDVPIALKASTRIELLVSGGFVTVMRGNDKVGSVRLTDPGIDSGRVVLGIYTERNAPKDGPYAVAFNDVQIWGLS